MKRTWSREDLAADVLASLVVFLVALPLCLGIALASGVPPALGLVTGIVGGLVVGAVQGTPFSVSGPAAGLTVLVLELVRGHGLAFMAAAVLAAGGLQILAGVLRGGRWFRAVPPAVVHGMLAGIGILIAVGQAHSLLGDRSRGDGLADLVSLPAALFNAANPWESPDRAAAACTGVLTVLLLLGWPRLGPHRLRRIPAGLVAVAGGTAVSQLFSFPIERVGLPDGLLAAVTLPEGSTFDHFTTATLWIAAVELALVASAETLLCCAAVDRMHSGPRTPYNRELVAQGIGNSVCGLLGALPMTAVIVRSTTNIRADARTRTSTILHGAWLLVLVALLPQLLELIPIASLAAILVVIGIKLVDRAALAELREHARGELLIYGVTVVGVVTTDLLKGVLAGLAVAALVLLQRLTHLGVDIEHHADRDVTVVRLCGAATFLQLPRLTAALEGIPADRELHLHLEGLTYLDHAAADVIASWEQAQRRRGRDVTVELRGVPVRAESTTRA